MSEKKKYLKASWPSKKKKKINMKKNRIKIYDRFPPQNKKRKK